jgi:hypothetical protein
MDYEYVGLDLSDALHKFSILFSVPAIGLDVQLIPM